MKRWLKGDYDNREYLSTYKGKYAELSVMKFVLVSVEYC